MAGKRLNAIVFMVITWVIFLYSCSCYGDSVGQLGNYVVSFFSILLSIFPHADPGEDAGYNPDDIELLN